MSVEVTLTDEMQEHLNDIKEQVNDLQLIFDEVSNRAIQFEKENKLLQQKFDIMSNIAEDIDEENKALQQDLTTLLEQHKILTKSHQYLKEVNKTYQRLLDERKD